jgi:predicted ATPase
MDYTAVGQITHLAARMEQMALPGSILLTQAVLSLAEGYVQVTPLGPMPVKGLTAPVDVFELVGASGIRRRLQATAARGLTRFVGRDTEFAALVQALERAGAGHGQVVAVVGEAGVGKSRLVYECVHSHHTQGWRVLESASVSYGKATPYFPVLDLLRRYAHLDEGDDARTIRAKVTGQLLALDEALQDAIPPLLALLDVLPNDSPFLTLDPPQRRQRTLAALKRVLLRESQGQSVLVVFEDLHWIDTETQALLDSLVESLPTACLLLLVNYRPEYQHAWGGKTYYAQLRLDPLPPANAAAFLQALLGDDPGLEALKSLLITRTAGNPFFLEESVRTLVETGVLVGALGSYRLVQALPTIQVPTTVQAVLAARMDRLPPEEKHLLQTAAVFGHEVLRPLLQERRRTLHARLIEAIEGLAGDRIAEVASGRNPDQVERLAHHALRGEVWDKAVTCCQQAGARAYDRAAFREAVAAFEQALQALAHLPEDGDTRILAIELRLALGSPLFRLGEYRRDLTLLIEAEALARALDDRVRLGWVLAQMTAVLRLTGDLDGAIAAGRQAIELAAETGENALQAQASYTLGHAYWATGDFRQAVELLQRSVEATDRESSTSSIGEAPCGGACTAGGDGQRRCPHRRAARSGLPGRVPQRSLSSDRMRR